MSGSATPRWIDDSWDLRHIRADLPVGDMFAALEETMPSPWVRRTLDGAGRGEHHPIVGSVIMRKGRFELIELGLALHVLKPPPSVWRPMLPPGGYRGVAGELLAGLLVHCSGGRVEYRPRQSGQKKMIDGLAIWPSGQRVVVEAKAPPLGGALRDACLRSGSFARALNDVFAGVAVDRFHHLDFHASEPALLSTAGYPSDAAIEAFGLSMGHAARARLPLPVGVHSLEPWGEVEVFHLDGDPRVQVGAQLFDYTPEAEVRRMRRWVKEAGEQISAQGEPGLVVIDARDIGGFDGYHHGKLFHIAMENEKWTRDIVAILVRTQWQDDDPLPSSIYRFVPGRRVVDLPIELFTALRECRLGHLHFEPLRPASMPLSCDHRR